MKTTLSIVIVTGKEEDMIGDCLKSALFADEIILVASPACNQQTISIAKSIVPKIKIIKADPKVSVDFSYWHNLGAKNVSSTWQLHLDCDERISPDLQAEIINNINDQQSTITNYDLPRANHYLGHRVHYGGSYPDYVKRLFKTSSFHQYHGVVHEQPQIDGQSSVTKSDLLHYTHRDLFSMLQKSNTWTSTEAQLLFDSHHPPVYFWRFPRMMLTKFFERFIRQQMWRDGLVGWVSVLFETFDTYMIYAKLYELQQNKI